MATLQENVAAVIEFAESKGLEAQVLEGGDQFVTGDDRVGVIVSRSIKLTQHAQIVRGEKLVSTETVKA